ncbi:MAG: ankyrin repeat-containing domain protein, partial [Podila humilis]
MIQSTVDCRHSIQPSHLLYLVFPPSLVFPPASRSFYISIISIHSTSCVAQEAITPLIIASYNGFASICRLLVTLGHVNVNQKDNTQKSALLLASYAGHVEIMAELIEHGAALDALDQYGWSSLMLAAYAGRLDACKLLLEHGADPHIKTSNGKNARSLSWDAGHKSIAVYISK